MLAYRKIILIIGCAATFILAAFIGKKMLITQRTLPSYELIDHSAIVDYFPKSVSEINQLADRAIAQAKKEIDNIIAVPDNERSFSNTAEAFDRATAYNFSIAQSILSTLFSVSTDKSIRDTAHEAMLRMQQFAVDTFGHNVPLYQAFKAYVNDNAKNENLSEKQWYYLNELMKDFKRAGLELPEADRKKAQELEKELSALSMQFSENINSDKSQLIVSKEQLAGLDEDFINSLEKSADGNYVLKMDYPTYFMVMEHGSNPETRKQLYYKFVNRAYPANLAILNDIVAKRDQLAKVLGFESYAHLNLDNEMAKNPKRVEDFLNELLAKASAKEDEEFKLLNKDLPEGVQLSADGKLYPWDKMYVSSQYKKKHYQLDNREIAEYYPMENTIKGLINIYEQFFNIKMTELPIRGLWHDTVTLMELRNKSDDALLGLILLDLYPRTDKYCHACEITIIPALTDATGIKPALAVVLANFPKSTPTKPSLLKLDEARTFFHEFGHAIHTIMGATQLAGTSGTNVKTDFVEMPSQMLEEWLWDPAIIKMLSHHYKTGEQMPDTLIKKIVDLKNFASGSSLDRQIMYAMLSLQLFGAGEKKDIAALQQKLHGLTRKHEVYDTQNHDFASFGHLTGYGARYYGYLWSKVFALDLFSEIQKVGLLNPAIGTKYASIILGNGGSVDPNVLLEQFLGRAPSVDAFITDMGLTAQ